MLKIVDLFPAPDIELEARRKHTSGESIISVVIHPKDCTSVARSFWQHSGDGISSRRAELCHQAFIDGFLVASNDVDGTCRNSGHPVPKRSLKGPLRYQKGKMADGVEDDPPIESGSHASIRKEKRPRNGDESAQFVEERYGRNLDFSLAGKAKLAIRRRIAGGLTANVDFNRTTEITHSTINVRQVPGISEDDWGPGCQFYGHGSAEDLDDLESRCQGGERFLALFCEFPGNPLLKCPDLRRIRALADRFDFAVIVDETIGNFLNIHVLPYADVVVSSLTKVFSGDSNVMGGSMILSPLSCYYRCLKSIMGVEYEDNYWAEDALFMERNSRDFVSRIARINTNAEAICDCLRASEHVKEIFYPKYSSTRIFYDQFRRPTGGYGGLLSITFRTRPEAVAFYDALETAKGPSLGTNFTLSSPYTLLAHYGELDWAAQYGVESNLVRMSVGLEDTAYLCKAIERALEVVAKVK
ncbi:MAG: hypothetical protein Q9216_000239 [Gyalolechia sp. 2 TL-2023]